MITRRKVFGWVSGLAAGLGLGTAATAAQADHPLALWRPTDQQLDQYRRLCNMRSLLLPGVYDLTASDKYTNNVPLALRNRRPLHRSLDILPVRLGDGRLVFHSHSGYDHQSRYFQAPLEALETARGDVWEQMKAALLPPATRTYAEQVSDQANELAKPFNEAHPDIEFTSWVDNTTDNALLRAYHVKEHSTCAYAITRKDIHEAPDLAALITECWAGLAAAMTSQPISAEYRIEQKPRVITKYA